MKIKINYLENILQLKDDKILLLEIENKNYFYRIINDLYSLSNSEIVEEITLYDSNDKELNNNKLKLFVNYFDFEFDSKRYSTDINKYIINEMDENDKNNLLKSYNKLIDTFLKILNKSDLPLQILEDITVDNIIKNLKLSINPKNVNKFKTLEKLCLDLNVNMEEVIFFGDGTTDLPLIGKAGLGVAMDNALNEVKEQAKETTLSNDENGIAYFLKRKIL